MCTPPLYTPRTYDYSRHVGTWHPAECMQRLMGARRHPIVAEDLHSDKKNKVVHSSYLHEAYTTPLRCTVHTRLKPRTRVNYDGCARIVILRAYFRDGVRKHLFLYFYKENGILCDCHTHLFLSNSLNELDLTSSRRPRGRAGVSCSVQAILLQRRPRSTL